MIGLVDHIGDVSVLDIAGGLFGYSCGSGAEPDDFRDHDVPDHLLFRIARDQGAGLSVHIVPEIDLYENDDEIADEAYGNLSPVL